MTSTTSTTSSSARSPVSIALEFAGALLGALFGVSFVTFYLLPLSWWRSYTSGTGDVEKRIQAKQDSLRALTDEAIAEVQGKCTSEYKKTVKSITIHHDDTGINQHCVIGGDARNSSELVVLLHGFPECWYTWHDVLPQLVNKGYFVVAPDMRGYGLSSAPPEVAAYRLPLLADDIRKVIAHFKTYFPRKEARVTVVGHDWGGGPTLELGTASPIVVDSIVVVNFPHPATFPEVIKRAPAQVCKSWYIFYWQIPGVVEYIHRTVPFLSRLNRGHSKFGHRLMEAAHAGKIGPMLNYYRALALSDDAPFIERLKKRLQDVWKYGPFASPPNASQGRKTPGFLSQRDEAQVPVLHIWGTDDVALSEAFPDVLQEQANVLAPHGLSVVKLPGVSHWVPTEKPLEVAEQVAKFIEEVVSKREEGDTSAPKPRVDQDSDHSELLGRSQGQHGVMEGKDGELHMVT